MRTTSRRPSISSTANITWVTTEVGKASRLRRADGRPHGHADDAAFPRTHGCAHGHAHGPAHHLPSPLPAPYPTAMCSELGARARAARRTACVARPTRLYTEDPTKPSYNEHMEKDFNLPEPDQCLTSTRVQVRRDGGDGQNDGDGTCEEMADYAYEGENMCDWWKWAYRYGPNKTETGPYATNWKTGHAYAEDGSFPKKWYSINGKNCSKWDVDVVSTDKCRASSTTATRRTATSPRPRATKP